MAASFRALASQSLDSARSSALRRLLGEIEAADSLSTDAHGRFRLLWILARDAPPLQSPARMRALRKHSNLYAPIETHDPKALAARMMAFVLPSQLPQPPSTTTTTASTAATSPAAPPLPRSRLQEFMLECAAAAAEGGVGLLPQTPLCCASLNDPDALSLEVLEVLVHAQMCRDMDWSIDARSWPTTIEPESALSSAAWKDALDLACAKVLRWILAHFSERSQYAQLVSRCYRELMPPRRVVAEVLSRGVPFEWMDPCFQAGLVRAILQPGQPGPRLQAPAPAQQEQEADPLELPPSTEHAWSFWSALASHIESEGGCVEVHEDIVKALADLLKTKTLQALKPLAVPAASHWTVTYRHGVERECSSNTIQNDAVITSSSSKSAPSSQQEADPEEEPEIELRTCTLRMEFGFSSTTGVSERTCARAEPPDAGALVLRDTKLMSCRLLCFFSSATCSVVLVARRLLDV